MKTILSKYYFDAVTSENDVIIGYEAVVELFGLSFKYSGFLYSKNDGTQKEYSSWRPGNGPHFGNRVIRWSPKGCKSEFEWYECKDGYDVILHNDSLSNFRWNCITPRAKFRGQIDRETFTGLGYIERIDMRLSSMRLPFKELLWGRAHVGDDSLVWISWKRGLERSWIWYNGQLVDGNLIGIMPDEIHFNGNIYILNQRRCLRNRPIHKALKGIIRLLSRGISTAKEEKVYGDITHTSTGEKGRVIFERVVWE